ncbi:MAG: DUF6800 family protein, partial [Pirellulales bacterium]
MAAGKVSAFHNTRNPVCGERALGLSERKSELRRRQKRRQQVARLKKRLGKATKSE